MVPDKQIAFHLEVDLVLEFGAYLFFIFLFELESDQKNMLQEFS
jgi:hypothetical protein